MRWLAIGLLTIVLAGTAVAASGPAAGSAAFLAGRQSTNGGFAEQGRVPDAPRPGGMRPSVRERRSSCAPA